ncbi:hypothetical protein FIBSPDRAFT_969849 [Athelia psychrophila]|uniref:Uncharacterized protein n=1 Tax=Athelia psychrophila TaxID=1759441 RepID=A0A167T4R7_9AGAM|nr:hypothetical protein FIBSPDRAFT_969849 [Fibularhizoctonia sp. CBS 109695]
MLNASNTVLKVSQDTLMKKIAELENQIQDALKPKIVELESQIQDALKPKIDELDSQVNSMKALLNPLTLSIIASSPFQDLDVNKTAALLEALVPNMLFPHQLVAANGPIQSTPPQSPTH